MPRIANDLQTDPSSILSQIQQTGATVVDGSVVVVGGSVDVVGASVVVVGASVVVVVGANVVTVVGTGVVTTVVNDKDGHVVVALNVIDVK